MTNTSADFQPQACNDLVILIQGLHHDRLLDAFTHAGQDDGSAYLYDTFNLRLRTRKDDFSGVQAWHPCLVADGRLPCDAQVNRNGSGSERLQTNSGSSRRRRNDAHRLDGDLDLDLERVFPGAEFGKD